MVGKWHLGDWEPFLPGNHGFDFSFFKAKIIDTEKVEKDGFDISGSGKKRSPYKRVFYKNGKLYDRDAQNLTETELYTSGAIEFIKDNKDHPFFLYFAHFLPHVPLRPSARFKGKSVRGLYGDCVQEMDWSVGEVLKTIDELNLTENTLVIFCSDNGPQLKALKAESGGKSGPFRDGKWTTFEGGTRTPLVARWPEKIKPGSQCHDLIGIIDMLPTFCSLAGANVPNDRVIDGVDISSCMFGQSRDNPPRETFAYFDGGGLFAFRYKKWKLFIKDENSKGTNVKVVKNKKVTAGTLFDLENDLAETKDVSSDYPEIAAKIKSMADKFLSDFEKNRRPAGRMK
jgi:arylsulfatase A-like enzyme